MAQKMQKSEMVQVIEAYEEAQRKIDRLCCYDVITNPTQVWLELAEYAGLEHAVDALVKSGKRSPGEIVLCVLNSFMNRKVDADGS